MSGSDDARQGWAKQAWIERVLGVTRPPQRSAFAGGAPVTMAAADPSTPLSRAALAAAAHPAPLGPGLLGPPSGAPIAPAAPSGAPTTCVAPNGRKLEVVVGKDGRAALTCPPAPIGEITFSGGGGKGAALPGAVAALESSGVLAGATELHGASVGSMTAAVLAAGMTAEQFTTMANDTKMGPIVKGGDLLPINLDGDKLEDFVRTQLADTVRGKIAPYLQAPGAAPDSLETLRAIDEKLAKGGGVTFGDLRTLSKIVPGIKELVIDGTMLGDDGGSGGAIRKGKPQLVVFSADTEPDLDVARAVHASAALPPVFKPVDIKLSSGINARFEDGGVMNNAPTTGLIGAERQVDPIPPSGEMTFVFQEQASQQILEGKATPSRSAIMDFIAGAPVSASDYAKNRGLADRPQDVVMVPLKFKGPWYKRTDFSGLIGGTINFDIPKDARLKLQEMTREATAAHIENRQLPETREFASTGQMLDCIGRDDLVTLAASNFAGAKEELAFRDAVTDEIAKLEALGAASPQDEKAKAAIARLNALAGHDIDRLGFVGRELNRSGKLDPLLDEARRAGGRGEDALGAGLAVADALTARSHAQTILRDAVYPKMVRENPKSVAGVLLKQVDNMLRGAQSPEDVNRALTLAIDHFSRPSGILRRPPDKAFADELTTYLMPTG